MFSRYFFSLLLVLLGTVAAQAQSNTPKTTETDPGGAINTIPVPPVFNVGSGTTPSYIRTYVPRIPITNAGDVNSASNPEQVQTATAYKDGFNRTIQAVQHYALTGSKRHLVQPFDTRFQAEEASYLPFPAGTIAYDDNEFARQAYYYANEAYPGEGYTAMSITRNMSNSAQRATKSLAPGRSQVGQNRGVTVRKVTNPAGAVKIWEPDGTSNKPIYKGTYAAGRLFGEYVFDTSGTETLTYTDMDGRVISRTVKQKDQPAGGGGVVTITGTTEYIYDVKGNLVCVMPPKASAAAGTGPSTAVLNSLCFRYNYDTKGRKIEQKFPGKDWEHFVYDKRNRVVMYQDGNLRAKDDWTFTLYDALDRPLCSGLVEPSGTETRGQYQYIIDNNVSYPSTYLFYYINSYDLLHTYPSYMEACTILSYQYYDNYNNADPADNTWNNTLGALVFNGELMNTPGNETPLRSVHSQGKLTGTKVRILPAPGADASKTGDWRETVNYYDKKGRVIYTASIDKYQGSALHVHYSGMQYDFADRSLKSKHKMYNLLDQAQPHTEWGFNEYDAITGNLLRTWHRTDPGAWNLQASYSYNDLARLSRKVQGDWGEVQDYAYNIRGQLKGINEYYALTGDRQGESRSFGQSLCYDYGFSQRRFDGKLAGMIWRGAGTSAANAYGYDYDYSGRLIRADYRRFELGNWSNALTDYSVLKLGYDRDGNIEGMDQYGVTPTGKVLMDQLSYTYENAGLSNRLEKVQDGATFYNLGDFNNTNGSATDYGYDPNGNLTSDANKNIASVTYTYFNKPEVVTFGDGKKMLYSYDAGGNKVQELITQPGKPDKRTDYVGNYVYENDALRYLQTGEGRTVYDTLNNRFKEEYFVKDNLGNVRSVVEVYVPPVAEYLATHEVASANLEGLFFDHLNHDPKPGGNPGDQYSTRLNGSDPSRRIGTSMLLKVMAGDKVEMNVNNYYELYDSKNDAPVSAGDMLNTIVTTLMAGGGGMPGEAHDIHKVTDAFNTTNYSVFDNMVNADFTSPNQPRAYLNYVLFDENMQLVSTMSGAFQANGSGTWTQIGTTVPLEIPQNGYMAVYLSNASRNLSADMYGNVYFDQLVIRFSRGKLKEEAHYYPHGLPIAGMGSTANGMIENRDKYQANGYIKDLGLNWMDFNNRQYDPQIGRFLSVDPLAPETDAFSPYAAMNNNPASLIDPNGLQVGQHREYAWGSKLNRQVWGAWQAEIDQWLKTNHIAEFIASTGWGEGGSVGVTTYYGDDARSFVADFLGIPYDPSGYVESGTTEEELKKNGYFIDKNDGTSIAYHWYTQSNPGDITSLKRHDDITLVRKSNINSMLSLLKSLFPTTTALSGVIRDPASYYPYDMFSKWNTSIADAAWLASMSKIVKYARIGESFSTGTVVTGVILDAKAVYLGQISWTKFWVNTGFGVGGAASPYLAPISVFYFSVDAFHPGGWDDLIFSPAPSTPTGYENIDLGLGAGFH
ncbi:RHS repeat-associated core domain-containing protein [Chitinophaga eiseniae]|uniref:RHS repeat-associated core domain-containing protein n=1 Tax=Chitinophaga eiseniae TaxID=634771 RepID=A0A1T4SXR9_9BACT|nr:RHS repeat-associated core domain-containing protein [Chitinophaga eiseniae]SKA32721.1 RHS repeat-associated core domain-containing protein [Chitinophaga eiseniae]